MRIGILDSSIQYLNTYKTNIDKKFDVYTYRCPEEFIFDFCEQPFDIVIMETVIDGEKIGMELIKKIRKTSSNVEILVISTNITSDDIREKENLNVKKYLMKPISLYELNDTLLCKPEIGCKSSLSDVKQDEDAGKPKIVVLDDRRQMRLLFKYQLPNYKIICCSSFSELKTKMIYETDIEGFILDFDLGEDSTFFNHIINYVIDKFPNSKVCMASGSITRLGLKRIYYPKIKKFFEKPIDFDSFSIEFVDFLQKES